MFYPTCYKETERNILLYSQKVYVVWLLLTCVCRCFDGVPGGGVKWDICDFYSLFLSEIGYVIAVPYRANAYNTSKASTSVYATLAPRPAPREWRG